MKKIYIISLILFFSKFGFAQSKPDGLNNRVISTYDKSVEVARQTITFTDNFTTEGSSGLHAYIDEFVQKKHTIFE